MKIFDQRYLQPFFRIRDLAQQQWKRLQALPMPKRIGVIFLLLVGLQAISLATFLILIFTGVFGHVPSSEELTYEAIQKDRNKAPSEIYSSDGQLLGKYYIEERVILKDTSEVSPHLVHALVATEDARFYEHEGVDLRAMLRVIVRSLLLQDESGGGGSTLSQQLAKNLFKRKNYGPLSMPVNKIKEIIIARRTESVNQEVVDEDPQYTSLSDAQRNRIAKNRVLMMYLNTVPFGQNAYGVGVAAQRYFSKSAKDLGPEEAAILVGMLKATTTYRPVRKVLDLANHQYDYNPKSLQRRNVVLTQMQKYGYLTQAQLDSLKALPLRVRFSPPTSPEEGLATHFREYLKTELQEWLRNIPKVGNEDQKYSIYTDGLKIYTTLDSRLQAYAEQAMEEHLAELQPVFEQDWKMLGLKPWARRKPDVYEFEEKDDVVLLAYRNSDRYKSLIESGKSAQEAMEAFDIKHPDSVRYLAWKTRDEYQRGLAEGDSSWKKEVVLTNQSYRDSVERSLSYLNCGFLATDPTSGQVKVWVGGASFRHGKVDHVNQRVKRQVGSTFKPLVYAAALQEGIAPCTYFDASPKKYASFEDYQPFNSDGIHSGSFSLVGALANSVNTISVKLLEETGKQRMRNMLTYDTLKGYSSSRALDSISMRVGIGRAREFALQRMGVKSRLRPIPSLALGSEEVSLYEMVGAYGTFANKGNRMPISHLDRIVDRRGNILRIDFDQRRLLVYNPQGKLIKAYKKNGEEVALQSVRQECQSTQVLTEEQAQVMVHMLRSVVNGGNAGSLKYKYGLYGNDVGGKTGTTQDNADGWFIGVTPKLVAGVWVGAEYPAVHFRSTSKGMGSKSAMPMFGLFMQRVNNDTRYQEVAQAKFDASTARVQSLIACSNQKGYQPRNDLEGALDQILEIGNGLEDVPEEVIEDEAPLEVGTR